MSSSSSSSTGPSHPDRFLYNVAWMNRTFHSRAVSESLLAPELENGNLTRRDYDALMTRLPGVQYSELAGFAISGLGAVAYSGFKPPKAPVVLVSYVAAEVLGKSFRLYAHRTCLQSIEDINGFSRAMENVKRKVGFTPGLLNFERPLSWAQAESGFQQEMDTPYGESPQAAAAPVASSTSTTPPPRAKSRWEEIRTVRRADGPGKSWENLRLGRRSDGTPLTKPSPSEPREEQSSSSEFATFRDTDRAAQQASFDAMLERERKMNSS
ncbi:hypothetical protein DFH06DRAFT_549768 [Mycena polygramma]|nr:hypothetical protein DFH06DRAFT_549768 [Mycena polygramma]